MPTSRILFKTPRFYPLLAEMFTRARNPDILRFGCLPSERKGANHLANPPSRRLAIQIVEEWCRWMTRLIENWLVGRFL